MTVVWRPNESGLACRLGAGAKYKEVAPKLAAIVEDDFEATLTFFDLDANLWRTMCSSNVVERINREMRRKFNDMGACKGEQAVTRTAALVAMKLSEDWKDTVVKGFQDARGNKLPTSLTGQMLPLA